MNRRSVKKWTSRAAVVATFVMVTQSVSAATMEKAKLLYGGGLLEEAKRELIDVATSDATADEKAGALYLLGQIAIDERRYESAVSVWTDAVRSYPKSPIAREIDQKLPLVRQLAASAGASTSVPEFPKDGDARHQPLRGVVVIVSGPEPEYNALAVNEVMNSLGSKGVRVSRGPNPAPSVPEVIQLAKTADSVAVLSLTLRFGYLESLKAECYDVSGRLLWDEKSTGSFGVTKAGVAEGLINRMKAKLEPHIGAACLPIG